MFSRALASAVLFSCLVTARAQEAFSTSAYSGRDAYGNRIPAESAWLDLRQTAPAKATPQSAPRWIESVTLVPVTNRDGTFLRSVFRIRVAKAPADMQLLLLRLFFDDNAARRPRVIAWDESGSQVLESGELGAGIELATSDTLLLPMIGVTCIDIDVPGDGSNVRGVYMDWMTSRKVAHPTTAQPRDYIPEPFSAVAPLRTPDQDRESLGTVTASLSSDTIRIGASVQNGAAFQFGLEAQPLMAMLSFEVSTPHIDAPPEVYVNGESLGPVSITLPDLADPGYRGEAERLIKPMRFRYTGWLRAQKLVPAAYLRAGTNEIIVISGSGTAVAAIRATQIQLKYLWDKFDYVVDPK